MVFAGLANLWARLWVLTFCARPALLPEVWAPRTHVDLTPRRCWLPLKRPGLSSLFFRMEIDSGAPRGGGRGGAGLTDRRQAPPGRRSGIKHSPRFAEQSVAVSVRWRRGAGDLGRLEGRRALPCPALSPRRPRQRLSRRMISRQPNRSYPLTSQSRLPATRRAARTARP